MKSFAKSTLLLIVVLLTAGGYVVAQTAEPDKEAASSGKVVNINTASQSELESLPGVGPSLAKRIVEFRTKNGNFKTATDLMAVQGIGEKTFENMKHLVAVK